MIALGIDPDTHDTGWAVVSDTTLLEVGVASISANLKGKEAVQAMILELRRALLPTLTYQPQPIDIMVVEGQRIYPPRAGRKSHARPNDILHLAQVAGACMAALVAPAPTRGPGGPRYLFPLPQEWKGTVPKGIHQARVLDALGMEFVMSGHKKREDRYCIPADSALQHVEGANKIKKGNWKHVIDGIGLAQWGLKEVSLRRQS